MPAFYGTEFLSFAWCLNIENSATSPAAAVDTKFLSLLISTECYFVYSSCPDTVQVVHIRMTLVLGGGLVVSLAVVKITVGVRLLLLCLWAQ